MPRGGATLDGRTRRSHRALDGEVIGGDGKFSNGCRYPGDPRGRGSEVWNCRCTMVASMPGTDALKDRNTKKLETSYEDWKAGRDPKSSGRTLKEFMETPVAERAASRPNMSAARVRDAIKDELRSQGKTARDFAGMTRAEQQAMLRDVMEREQYFRTAAARMDAERMAVVDMEKVGGKSYRKNVEKVFGKDMTPLVHDDLKRMLGHRSGTLYEDIYAYDLDSGKRIGSTTNQRITYGARMTQRMRDDIREARAKGHRVAIAHNHPGSSAPSASDIRTIHDAGAEFGVIACHDGSILRFEQVREPIGGYNSITDEDVARIQRFYSDDENGLFAAYESELGVKVERLA